MNSTQNEERLPYQRGINPRKQESPTDSITDSPNPLSHQGPSMYVPHVVIDSELPPKTVMSFIHFLRLYGKTGYFTGTLKQLQEDLKLTQRTEVYRIVHRWIEVGWVFPDENETSQLSFTIASNLLYREEIDNE